MVTEAQYQQLGKTWVSSDGAKRRIYFPETLLTDIIGLTYTTYNTGNIRSASLKGQPIAHRKADQIRTTLRYGKAYVDCHDSSLRAEGFGSYTDTILAGLAQRASV